MSHNIVIRGYGMFPWQTTTELTYYVLANATGKNALEADLHALELLRAHTHRVHDPAPLFGKDARNQYLIKQRQAEIDEIDEMIDNIQKYIRSRGGVRRLVESN